MSTFPKLIVTGHKGHGKDTVCKMIEQLYGLKYGDCTMLLVEAVSFPDLASKYNYTTAQECYDNKNNHRKEMYDGLNAYNTPDTTRFGRYVFEHCDMYCGLRNIETMLAMEQQALFDFSIWVDSLDRKPPESKDSMTITLDDCDYIIDNNGTEEELKKHVIHVMDEVLSLYRYGLNL